MAIAHICRHCGQGLSRVRARREPHYGLSVVTCPRCGHTSARSRPWTSRAWHTLLRRVWISALLMLKLGMTVFLLVMMTASIVSFYEGDFELFAPDKPRGFWLAFVVLMIGFPVLTGAWLTFAFSYLDRRAVFGTWVGVIACFILIASVSVGIGRAVDDIPAEAWSLSTFWTHAARGLRDVAPMCLTLLLVMMLVSLAGIPLGRIALSARQVMTGWHFRWMLRRRRLRRSYE